MQSATAHERKAPSGKILFFNLIILKLQIK